MDKISTIFILSKKETLGIYKHGQYLFFICSKMKYKIRHVQWVMLVQQHNIASDCGSSRFRLKQEHSPYMYSRLKIYTGKLPYTSIMINLVH